MQLLYLFLSRFRLSHLIYIGLVLSLLLNWHYRSVIRFQKDKIRNLQESLNYYMTLYDEKSKELMSLQKQVQIMQSEYQTRIEKLVKLANKPPKVITVPKIIEKRIYVTPKECQQMAVMIDQFLNMTSGGK